MFQDLRFDISFADALFLIPRFAPTIRDLLMNKEKLLELVKIPLNENCSAMLLKKLPEKLGDPGKFLIPCEFPRMEICHALADLVYEGEIDLRVDNEPSLSFRRKPMEGDGRIASTDDKSSDHDDCDPEEDIYVLEQLLNEDPFQLPPMDLKQRWNYRANLQLKSLRNWN
ncbi:hypothetical protein Tco_0016298 [Tanacetum coccineum]